MSSFLPSANEWGSFCSRFPYNDYRCFNQWVSRISKNKPDGSPWKPTKNSRILQFPLCALSLLLWPEQKLLHTDALPTPTCHHFYLQQMSGGLFAADSHIMITDASTSGFQELAETSQMALHGSPLKTAVFCIRSQMLQPVGFKN